MFLHTDEGGSSPAQWLLLSQLPVLGRAHASPLSKHMPANRHFIKGFLLIHCNVIQSIFFVLRTRKELSDPLTFSSLCVINHGSIILASNISNERGYQSGFGFLCELLNALWFLSTFSSLCVVHLPPSSSFLLSRKAEISF